MFQPEWWATKFYPPLPSMYDQLITLFKGDLSDIMAQVNIIGNPLESFAIISSIIGLILQARHNIWGWIFMAISAAIIPFILYNYYGLVADAAVWIVMFIWFFTSAIWGWGYWINHRKEHTRRHLGIAFSFKEMVRKSHLADLTLSPEYEEDEIKRNVHGLESIQIFILLPLIILITLSLGWVLSELLPTMFSSWGFIGFRPSLPYWDALTTTLVCFAQLLLIGKYWEAWPMWMAVSFFSVAVYAQKGAWLFVLMYLVLFVISSISTINWYISYKRQKKRRWEAINDL